MRLLVTGGAGFVGANLALAFKRDFPAWQVTALDNLYRKGSELSVPRLAAAGVTFERGDVRTREDIDRCGAFDLLIECSAEPSAKAGYGESPGYLIDTNLGGAVNCLEACRENKAGMVFLSTSRVYPLAGLRDLPLVDTPDGLDVPRDAAGPGWSYQGVTVDFPLTGPRSLYGATKLGAELLITEYVHAYDLPCTVLRAGMISGSWQMGKVDQGVVVLWASRHLFGGTLDYIGWGGTGQQRRDVLHVDDLYDLVRLQAEDLSTYQGRVFNAGGGRCNAVSLRALTAACEERAGRSIAIGSVADTHDSDIPWYVTDNAAVTAATGWAPKRTLDVILDDVFDWLHAHRATLQPLLAG